MSDYTHKVQYYETDRMGITHHSNYIRWMEEARTNFLEEIGFGYDKLEAAGIISPVIGVECRYKKTTTYPDLIRIHLEIAEFKGVKLKISYTMYKEDELVLEGLSEHAFLDRQGIPIRLKKEFPEFYAKMLEFVGKET